MRGRKEGPSPRQQHTMADTGVYDPRVSVSPVVFQPVSAVLKLLFLPSPPASSRLHYDLQSLLRSRLKLTQRGKNEKFPSRLLRFAEQLEPFCFDKNCIDI